ncbi:unnamed protein product [Calypogeia fissa]
MVNLPFIPPPLGTPPPGDLLADVQAVPSSGLIRKVFTYPSVSSPAIGPVVPRRSDRSTKGIPPLRFEELQSSVPTDIRHLLLSQAPPTLLYTFSTRLDHSSTGEDLPRTHHAAMVHLDAEKWRAAEQLELQQLQRLHVADLVPLPKGAKLLPSKWVYTRKRNGIFKARFVVRGDKQRPGMDYSDTFASVVRLETFRMVMALIAAYNLEAHCWDIVTAFLNALIQAGLLLYVHPPPGYETYDADGNLLIWLLLRALYGLKQAPRLWYQELTAFLITNGFLVLPSDPCVLQGSAGQLLLVWVDDIVAIAPTLSLIQNMKDLLESKYQLRDMGDLEEYLGISVVRDRSSRTLYLHQASYAERILHRFHLQDCIPVSSPSLGTDDFPLIYADATQEQRRRYQAMHR